MNRKRFLTQSIPLLAAALWLPNLFAQTAPNDSDSVRVNMTVNPDGTRTNFTFDTANHKAIAITTDEAGKRMSKTVYRLDPEDRFGTSVTFNADGTLRHKSIYKYNVRGQMEQETQLDRNDAVRAKIVYSYDSSGKQSGYSVFDANGKLLGQTSGAGAAMAPAPQAPPKKKK